MIAIGSDHGGFALKEKVMQFLKEEGIPYHDMGCYTPTSCDYPTFGRMVAMAVAEGACEKGIVICTTGIGISITANKVKGVRCALCNDLYTAKMTRLHNDANVLAMGGGVVGENVAREIVKTFLETEFSGEEKHIRRIRLMEDSEILNDTATLEEDKK
jgi:ribose 5-phosphate isomerase B